MAAHLLHGTIEATIYEIDSLRSPNCVHDLCGKETTQKSRGGLLSQAKRLMLCQPEIVGSRLYATIDLEKARVGRTRITDGEPTTNPRWNERFLIYCAHRVSNIIFTIKDDDPIGATLIGRAYLAADQITDGRSVDAWIPILDQDHNPIYGSPRIRIKLQFLGVARDTNWSKGITSGDSFHGVPRTFFMQRRGCSVSLYQDAHIATESIPKVLLSGEDYHTNHRCWEDVFDAISNAKHLIYIAGWSVNAKITLVRDFERRVSEETLGELLKKKAEEGVRVLMLVWDDPSSDFYKGGLMATHDQETAAFFKFSKVQCVLCPRYADSGKSALQKLETSAMFTHHQKTVVVDSEAGETEKNEKKRTIVSFVGGIDLFDGRYDTPEHSLFRTLNSAHRSDFHQPNFVGASIGKGGPREPWHDIHCRLEGPIAWDVLYNFEQRWTKQVGGDKLIPFADLYRNIIKPSPAISPENPESWNVQLFRSIDGGVVSGFPKNPQEAAQLGLVSGKDVVIDRSIQDAYINAIRRAKSFIYIENQYFLGSSFGWKLEQGLKIEDIAALHLIPKELSLKIVSKIEAGERFVVYVVIPMWPEGEPESTSVQAILDWQRRTMEMMYGDIAAAIRRKGLADASPRDYLSFFCLGNRETVRAGEYVPPETPPPDSDYGRAQLSRRFMIYVHAKMMIVDDEYIIIGSANINQRSMDGGRDSEIAMGGYQPHHLAAKSPARGHIYGFRMALWWEHLRVLDEIFIRPEAVECVRRVNDLASDNWVHYASDTFDDDLPGHMLRYPVEITSDGDVQALPGTVFFPDTKAPVIGTRSDQLPAILTT